MGTGKRSFLEAGVASEPAELRGGAGAGTLRESVGAGRGRPTGTRVFSCLHVARGAGRSGPRRGGTGTLGAGSAHVIPRRLPRGRRGGGKCSQGRVSRKGRGGPSAWGVTVVGRSAKGLRPAGVTDGHKERGTGDGTAASVSLK